MSPLDEPSSTAQSSNKAVSSPTAVSRPTVHVPARQVIHYCPVCNRAVLSQIVIFKYWSTLLRPSLARFRDSKHKSSYNDAVGTPIVEPCDGTVLRNTIRLNGEDLGIVLRPFSTTQHGSKQRRGFHCGVAQERSVTAASATRPTSDIVDSSTVGTLRTWSLATVQRYLADSFPTLLLSGIFKREA